ncbi:unnamed protein product [Mesocestoides corti]|uniref:Uncharacterized protein n=1 Tax=Mesocestoides corti TaxID=53468 RepID=A0A0R3UFS1_MESCO|nr:unnamed protein product [Mesocestoides corti]
MLKILKRLCSSVMNETNKRVNGQHGTYNKQAFDDCSTPTGSKFSVNILYRCSFKSSIEAPSAQNRDTSHFGRWLSRSLGNHSITSTTPLSPTRARLPTMKRPQRGQRSGSAGSEQGEAFTLLINEVAWSTGIPSFQKNRPVFFTGDLKCSQKF